MKSKATVIAGMISMCVFATGCASQAVKDATANVGRTDIAYAAILDVKPADTDKIRSNCSRNSGTRWTQMCADLASYSVANVAFLHSSRLVTATVGIPKEWRVSKGSIIELAPKKSSVAVRLAAAEPHAGCEWTGTSLDFLTGRSGMVEGFALGLLIVPAVAMASDDSLTEGGVECDGWSYKSLMSTPAKPF